jgi:hypothetical protein
VVSDTELAAEHVELLQLHRIDVRLA